MSLIDLRNSWTQVIIRKWSIKGYHMPILENDLQYDQGWKPVETRVRERVIGPLLSITVKKTMEANGSVWNFGQ